MKENIIMQHSKGLIMAPSRSHPSLFSVFFLPLILECAPFFLVGEDLSTHFLGKFHRKSKALNQYKLVYTYTERIHKPRSDVFVRTHTHDVDIHTTHVRSNIFSFIFGYTRFCISNTRMTKGSSTEALVVFSGTIFEKK